MGRCSFSLEFKLEAVQLVRERGVSDLDLHPNMLRNWVRDFSADPAQAFPGQGQMKPEQGTVLGPEANEADRNHLHLYLAARKRSAFCE
jgi:transposase